MWLFELNYVIYGAGCMNEFNIDVWYIWPNSMDYEKVLIIIWGVGRVGYTSEWACGSIWSAYVNWNI